MNAVNISELSDQELSNELKNRKEAQKQTILTEIEQISSKSGKIKHLDKNGYSRSEIAKILNIRYQHVRNVLIAQKPN